MKRRDFIKLGALGSVPVLVGWNTAIARALQTQIACGELHDRIMVVVILPGGLDSINFLIPTKHTSTYRNLRPTLSVTNPIRLTNEHGLHPELDALRRQYDNGCVSFVDAIGYEKTSGSHFTSMDLVFAGGGGHMFPSKGGTTGRMMESIYPYYPVAFPNGDNMHPIALQFGSLTTSNIMLNTNSTSMGLTQFDDVSDFHEMITSVGWPMVDLTGKGEYKRKLNYIRDTAIASNQYAINLLDAWNKGKNYVNYTDSYHTSTFIYPDNIFMPPLKAIARLIDGGCDTRLYVHRVSGNIFDTHSNQEGQFDQLIYHLSNAISDFIDDLKAAGNADRVLGLTLSEFGRQIRENSGGGTDHGTFYASTVFGSALNGGIYGDPIDITKSQYNRVSNKNYDYRELLYVFAKDWLGLDQDRMKHSELEQFQNTGLDLISGSQKAPSGCYSTFSTEPPKNTDVNLQVYPNPSNGVFRVKTEGFSAANKHLIEVFTLDGRKVFGTSYSLVANVDNEVHLSRKGFYVLRVTTTSPNGEQTIQSKKIVVN